MELFSEDFRRLVILYLDSKNSLLATISKVYQDPLIESIKKRNDVILFNLTPENRKEVFEKVKSLVLQHII